MTQADEERQRRSDRVRPIVEKAVRDSDLRNVAKEAGVSRGTLHNLIHGGVLSTKSLDKIDDWIAANEGTDSRNGGQPQSPSEPGERDAWLREQMGKPADNMDAWERALRLEAVAAILLADAHRDAERAAVLRAQALLQAHENAYQRTGRVPRAPVRPAEGGEED